MRRLELRIRHLVDELHHQVAHWLVMNHDVVVIPKFSTQSVSKKKDSTGQWKRKINKKTVSNLYSLAHFRFRQFLNHKAMQHGVLYIEVTEEYTTKTCSRCGHMYEVGASETFDCPYCGLIIDRDINAAINILLKFIHDNQAQHQESSCAVAVQRANLMYLLQWEYMGLWRGPQLRTYRNSFRCKKVVLLTSMKF